MKKILTVIICIAAVLSASAQSQRERINFDNDWEFAFGDASSPAKDFGCGTEYFNYLTKAASIHNEGPYSQKFDASGWASVDLPHDWVVDLPYAGEASHSHGYKTVGYKYPETSVGWYRKTFTVPAEDYGKHIWPIIRCRSRCGNSKLLVLALCANFATQCYGLRLRALRNSLVEKRHSITVYK